jgi:GT2 family glycosyltransferase
MRNLTASLLNINEAELTIDVMDKLACLSAQDWAVQLILVDNGSRPDQLRCLLDWCVANRERFKEMLFLAASRNLGGNGGHNVSFKLASSDRILLLDNDMVLPDGSAWLDGLWQRMDEDACIGIVGPLLVFAEYPDIVQGAGIGLTEYGRVGYLGRGEPVGQVPCSPVEVAASPAACWLVRRRAQQAVGSFADEFYPMQYWDVDFCVRLGLAGWKIVCERGVRIKHIENVTTRNLKNYPYARVSVQHWMRFREKWADVLPKIATLAEDDIYWRPIPRNQMERY